MKIALFGGTGFIGGAVAAVLKDTGHSFFEVSRSGNSEHSVHADIIDYESLIKIKESADVAIICSSLLPKVSYQDGDIAPFISVNIAGVSNMLRWARERGVRKIVYCSTLSMVPLVTGDETELIDSSSHYLYKVTKAAGEHFTIGFCKQHGIDFVVLRIASVYGQGMKKDVIHVIRNKIKKNEKFEINNSNTSIDFIHLHDVVRTIIESLKPQVVNSIINVASCRQITLKELVGIIGRLSGIENFKIHIKSNDPIPSRTYSNEKMMLMIRNIIPLEVGLKELLDDID